MAAPAPSAGLLGLGQAALVCWNWGLRPVMGWGWAMQPARQGPADWPAGMAGERLGVFAATLAVDGAPE